MFTRHTLLFPLMLAAMLALLTFWINQAVEKNGPKTDGSNRHDHDYIVNNFHTTKTDLLGNLHYVLAATEMEHFPDDDSTVLQRPRFTQYSINKPYTQITGQRGYVSSGGEEIQFVDNVKVVRPAFEGKGEMELVTEKLTIYPDDEIAKTDNPVVITQFPKTVIHATGMLLNKKDQTLVLGIFPDADKNVAPARVHVHYEHPVKTAAGSSAKTHINNNPPESNTVISSTSNSSTLTKTHKPSASRSGQTKRIRRIYE